MHIIKQSETDAELRRLYFVSVETPEVLERITGALTSPVVTISKNGAAAASATNGTPTEYDAGDHPGCRYVQLDAAECDTVGVHIVHVSATGMEPRELTYQVTADGVYATPGLLHSGTAQAGAASTITLATAASSSNGRYVDGTVVITGGTGAGQLNTIAGYVGSTRVATIAKTWTTNPDNTSTYAVFQNGTPIAFARELLEEFALLGSHTLGDLIRLATAVLAGPVLDFTTNTLVFKCPVTDTTRLTVTTSASGRLTTTIGTLT